jgi:hypothetical protein
MFPVAGAYLPTHVYRRMLCGTLPGLRDIPGRPPKDHEFMTDW